MLVKFETERIKLPQFAWHKIHSMVTFGMGLMFLAIHYLWIMWEKGLIFQYTSGLRDRAVPSMSLKSDQRMNQDVRTDTINYLARLLCENQNFDWYCLNYFLVLVITGTTIVCQLWYLHLVFSVQPLDFRGYNELYQNMQVSQLDRISNENDTAILRFPLNFHCNRYQIGTAGAKISRQVLCDNEVNGWVEFFYIANIYTMLGLALMWLLTLIQTGSALLCFDCFTPKSNKNYQKVSNIKKLSYGKRLFFLLLSQNVEPLFWSDVVNAINDYELNPEITNFV